MALLQVAARVFDERAVVKVRGDVTAGTAPGLTREIEKLSGARVVVDLREARICDPGFLWDLDEGVRLRLTRSQRTDLDQARIVRLFETIDRALLESDRVTHLFDAEPVQARPVPVGASPPSSVWISTVDDDLAHAARRWDHAS